MLPRRFQLWMVPEQLRLAQDLVALTNATCSRVGCTVDTARAALGSALAAPTAADLRGLLASATPEDGPIVLLDSGELVRAERARPDAELLRDLRSRGVPLLSIEPLPARPVDLAAAASALSPASTPAPVLLGPSETPMAPERDAAMRSVAGLFDFLGLSRHAGRLAELPDVVTQYLQHAGMLFGDRQPEHPISAAAIVITGNRSHGSLTARMADAVDLLSCLMGHGESVTALVLPGQTGNATMHIRFGSNRSATILVSLEGAALARHVTLTGSAGCIEASERTLVWTGPDGEELDRTAKKPRKTAGTDPASPFALEIASRLSRVLDTGSTEVLAASGRPDLAATLACVAAAVLSSSTGAAERPAAQLSTV